MMLSLLEHVLVFVERIVLGDVGVESNGQANRY